MRKSGYFARVFELRPVFTVPRIFSPKVLKLFAGGRIAAAAQLDMAAG
jgi:hypothetical protein